MWCRQVTLIAALLCSTASILYCTYDCLSASKCSYNPFDNSCKWVVLYSTQRSGTSWLMELLSSHPKMWLDLELFVMKKGGRFYRYVEGHVANFSKTSNSHRKTRASKYVIRFLEDYFENVLRKTCAQQQQRRVCGFKLMYNQAHMFPAIWKFLQSKQFFVIHLVRENLLDIQLSSQRARETRRSHCPIGRCNITQERERSYLLQPSSLLRDLKMINRSRQRAELKLENSGLKYVEISYEKLISMDSPPLSNASELQGGTIQPNAAENLMSQETLNRKPAYQEMCKLLHFLHYPCSDINLLHTSQQKIIVKSHREVIANFDELEATLAGTEWASQL